MLSLSDLSFSGGGDDEGMQRKLGMHVLADGDCGVSQLNSQPIVLICLKRQDDMVWRGTVEGSAGARCSSSLLVLLYLSQHSIIVVIIDDLHYHNCLTAAGWSAGPPYPLLDQSQQCSLVIGL
ncbi:hypothetical protein Tco_0819251 [Tanacetum coccineum]|uniref:Uncharacterized protein n=1 Tax=Tanacetum coccineum TaxID=301880 RepID=A0ABQ5A8L8_9ASTR